METHRRIFILLCLGAACLARGEDAPCNDGQMQLGRELAAGVPEKRVDEVRAGCRKLGFSEKDTKELINILQTARQESLPAECLLLRIEEGLSKRVPVAVLKSAVEKRLELLRRADALVMSVRGRRGGQHQHLVSHICIAMESGLPEEVLSNVFSRNPQFRYGRMIHVVEAGEALQLEGLAPAEVQQVMNECLARNLTRPEVFRAADFITAQHRKGRAFAEIHQALWNPAD